MYSLALFALFITHRGTCSLYKDIEFFLYESIFMHYPGTLVSLCLTAGLDFRPFSWFGKKPMTESLIIRLSVI